MDSRSQREFESYVISRELWHVFSLSLFALSFSLLSVFACPPHGTHVRMYSSSGRCGKSETNWWYSFRRLRRVYNNSKFSVGCDSLTVANTFDAKCGRTLNLVRVCIISARQVLNYSIVNISETNILNIQH